jgi:predicted amidophosphoribosyltransferase
MGLQLLPGWPLDTSRELLSGPPSTQPVAEVDGFAFDFESLLASALAPAGTVPIGRLLRRKPGPAPQSQLSLEERQEAPFGLFAASPARLPQLKGASVLLVDDVCTTGATLAASARALYAGGAQWVEALVFARTLRQEAR